MGGAKRYSRSTRHRHKGRLDIVTDCLAAVNTDVAVFPRQCHGGVAFKLQRGHDKQDTQFRGNNVKSIVLRSAFSSCHHSQG
jgi:hypothetical protein